MDERFRPIGKELGLALSLEEIQGLLSGIADLDEDAVLTWITDNCHISNNTIEWN